jgi:hypothetical protein
VGERCDPVTAEPAVKYSLFGSYRELDEFGIGISLYFRQLMLLFVVLALCACVNLSTIQKNMLFNPEGIDATLEGSVLGASREDLTFADQGTADIVTCCILAVFVFALKKIESKNIEQIDLGQQTPTDYSVRLRNVPTNVTNPDDYRRFFQDKWGDVVFVTIAYDNGPFMKALANVREHDEVIASKAAADAALAAEGKPVIRQADLTAEQVAKQSSMMGGIVTLESLQKKREELQAEAEKLARVHYKPRVVYITFNTEASQRRCLRDCATGILEEALNIQCCSTHDHSTFEGHVLRVDQPVEPSEVIYENFHVGIFEYYFGFVKSYALTAGILGISYAILQSMTTSAAENEASANDEASTGTMVAAVFVSMLNGALPTMLKMITLKMEVHLDEGDVQTSMLRKLMVARCLNTAVLIYAVTDFTDQFGKANLTQIQSILIADCVTAPIMRILNIYEHVMHYVVAPTKKTQTQMNVLFQGAYWNLAERYTDMIKTLFVGLFYSTILPSSLFITAAAMLSTYFVDKYCLLRMWSRPPMYDEDMAVTSRKMIMVCVWVHLIMARIFFANWPYQNVAEDKADCNLFTCTEPPISWTDDQRSVVNIYETIGSLVFFFGIMFLWFRAIKGCISKIFCATGSDEVGAASSVQFRNLTGVNAYCPNLRRATLVNPLFACDVGRLPRSYIPCRPTDFNGELLDPNTLSFMSDRDCPWATEAGSKEVLFGSVRYYAPNEMMPASNLPGVHTMAARGAQQIQMTMQNGMQNMAGAMPAMPSMPAAMPRMAGGMGMPQMAGGMRPMQQPMPQMAGGMPQMAPMAASVAAAQPLPEGWEEKQAPDGRAYYVNHNTQETQWTRPRYAPPVQNLGGAAGAGQAVVLPPGWEQKHAPDGRVYFVDHNTGSTSWTPPGAATGV